MDAIKKRLLEVLGASGDYDSADNVPLTVTWSNRLCSKRIVTDDFARAEKSRIVASRTGMAGIKRPPRIFYSKPSDTPLNDKFANHLTSRLMNLPTKIRLQIIMEALKPCRSSSTQGNGTTASSGLALIFTCKQLYVEAGAIAFRNNVVKESDLPLYVVLRDRGGGMSNISMDVKRGYTSKTMSYSISLYLLSLAYSSPLMRIHVYAKPFSVALFQSISIEITISKLYANMRLGLLKIKVNIDIKKNI